MAKSLDDYRKLDDAALKRTFNSALERQSRADTNEAWLSDQYVMDKTQEVLTERGYTYEQIRGH